MIRILAFAGVLLTATPTNGQDYTFRPASSVALKKEEGKALLRQCSRSSPAHVSEFWDVTPADIDMLEHNFRKILIPPEPNTVVPGLEKKAFQYVGVVINGQRYIYINAGAEACNSWQTNACVICDGGIYFWGALFNVSTKEFSEISFNGYA
jgi:hypothetical protein